MTRRYESELKDLLEETALRLDDAGGSLDGLVMPANVRGVQPPTVGAWLDLRAKKRAADG